MVTKKINAFTLSKNLVKAVEKTAPPPPENLIQTKSNLECIPLPDTEIT